MPAAMTALATITLGSAASSVTFGSIPATYRDLRLVISSLTTSSTSQVLARFNGDSGTNYRYVTMNGTGSSTSSSTDTGETAFYVGFSNPASTVSQGSMDLLDYSATDKHKPALVNRSNSGSEVIVMAQRWASTSAVTSIVVSTPTANMAIGTTLSLYGIAS